MNTYKNLKININDSILIITISRTQSLNALNIETIDELAQIAQEAYQNEAVQGIILTGDGEKAFVAGADIKEIAGLNSEKALIFAQNGQKVFKMFEDCPKPIIAAINGFALGGGCELAMACHMRIASESAKFGQPEVNLGIIPGYGGTQRLTQLVGRGKALELMLSGDIISAQEAKSIGLVNHVLPTQQEMLDFSVQLIKKILTKGPVAVASVIKAVNAGFSFEQQGYEAEATQFAACTETSDFKEGTSAFIEKRKPAFTGR